MEWIRKFLGTVFYDSLARDFDAREGGRYREYYEKLSYAQTRSLVAALQEIEYLKGRLGELPPPEQAIFNQQVNHVIH